MFDPAIGGLSSLPRSGHMGGTITVIKYVHIVRCVNYWRDHACPASIADISSPYSQIVERRRSRLTPK